MDRIQRGFVTNLTALTSLALWRRVQRGFVTQNILGKAGQGTWHWPHVLQLTAVHQYVPQSVPPTSSYFRLANCAGRFRDTNTWHILASQPFTGKLHNYTNFHFCQYYQPPFPPDTRHMQLFVPGGFVTGPNMTS